MDDDLKQRLKTLAAKQDEWRTLDPAVKLDLLDEIIRNSSKVVKLEGWEEIGIKTIRMMGIPESTTEGKFQASSETLIAILTMHKTLDRMRHAYGIRTGKSKKISKLTNLSTRYASNGQVVAKIHPLLTKEKYGAESNQDAEVWFQKEFVQDTTQVKPFSFDHFDDKANNDIMVVLGAGNQTFLTFCDLLEGLFIHNRVVFVKHHPLRGEILDPLLRKLMSPLYERGYLESELDHSIERTSAILYSPYVGAVHMTGGKKTHDAIV